MAASIAPSSPPSARVSVSMIAAATASFPVNLPISRPMQIAGRCTESAPWEAERHFVNGTHHQPPSARGSAEIHVQFLIRFSGRRRPSLCTPAPLPRTSVFHLFKFTAFSCTRYQLTCTCYHTCPRVSGLRPQAAPGPCSSSADSQPNLTRLHHEPDDIGNATWGLPSTTTATYRASQAPVIAGIPARLRRKARVLVTAPPAPSAVMAAGTSPPIATLWASAKRLPAATFPMRACMPAAMDPVWRVRTVRKVGIGKMDRPATGPATPKPTTPRTVPQARLTTEAIIAVVGGHEWIGYTGET
ncbi:hypothetical protein BC834DRAFT_274846 [Gloeopeniophorella convolvens]|nr:hypothetical protein BC834DRAFT_274846 [Gloeopeniophorella convolvens]